MRHAFRGRAFTCHLDRHSAFWRTQELQSELRHAAFQRSLALAAEAIKECISKTSVVGTPDETATAVAQAGVPDGTTAEKQQTPPASRECSSAVESISNASSRGEPVDTQSNDNFPLQQTAAVKICCAAELRRPTAATDRLTSTVSPTIPDCIGWAQSECKPKFQFQLDRKDPCEAKLEHCTTCAPYQPSATTCRHIGSIESRPSLRNAPLNLFGKIIRNNGDIDAVGSAMGCSVVLPRRGAFLMSDVRNMQPLVQGSLPPRSQLAHLRRASMSHK